MPTPPQPPLPLPTRDGVGASCVALPPGPWPTVAAFLTERFAAIAPAVWQRRIANGEVVDEHGVTVTASRPYQPHLRVYYYRALDVEPRIPFDEFVVFQDEHIVVADKPHFLPVTPSGRYLQETLLVRLKRRLGINTLAPMHRLDRETAGLVLFAVQPATRGAYHGVFMQHRVHKHYEAVAPWRSDVALPLTRHSRIEEGERFFYQREVPGVPNATTQIELLARQGDLGHYRLTPVTGKQHQLRVHMNALGLPLRGDRFYPEVQDIPVDDFTAPLQLLARSLAFTDPITGQARYFESTRQLAAWPPQHP